MYVYEKGGWWCVNKDKTDFLDKVHQLKSIRHSFLSLGIRGPKKDNFFSQC